MPKQIKRKQSNCTFESELCEKCGKSFRKGHLLKHQSSKSCIKKFKTAAELENKSILDYFKTVSAIKTLLPQIAVIGLIICTLNVMKF